MLTVRTLAAIAAMLPAGLWAQGGGVHQHHAMMAKEPGIQPIAISGLKIPDVVLVNQRGEKVHFYSDLIAGRIVVINTIFTTCTTICPLMGANFARLRKGLSDQERQKINLISISVDPTVDTPERLDEWSRGFGPMGPGWTLLTGPKADVDSLLRALQVFTADKQEHAPVALIGGEGAGDWARASALLPVPRLSELIHERLGQAAGHSIPRL